MRGWIMLAMPIAFGVAVGCSKNEEIHAESTSGSGAGDATSGSATGGHHMGAGGGSTGSTTSGAGGGGAGACCSEPVKIAGPVKTVTADTDLGQLVSGTALAGQKMIDGPFVLTDIHASGTNMSLSVGPDCGASARTTVYAKTSSATDLGEHGMRIPVPAGSVLCNDHQGPSVYFSGFRPY